MPYELTRFIPPTPDWLEDLQEFALNLTNKTGQRLRSITLPAALSPSFGVIPGESVRVATAAGMVIVRFQEY